MNTTFETTVISSDMRKYIEEGRRARSQAFADFWAALVRRLRAASQRASASEQSSEPLARLSEAPSNR